MPFTDNIALTVYFLILSLALGCIVGSFLNVVIWRLPRGESLCHPPSHCPHCGHLIRAWENIPIISWLLLRRRCSACRQLISWRYPAGEAVVGLLYAGIFWHLLRHGLPLTVLPGKFWLAGALLAAALIDAEKYYIPDSITVSGMLAALLLAVLLPQGHMAMFHEPEDAAGRMIFQAVFEKLCQWFPAAEEFLHRVPVVAFLDSVLGILICGGGLALVAMAGKLVFRNHPAKIEAIGLGDVKLLAMIAAFLGADAGLYILLGGAILGFLFGLAKIAWKKSPAGLLGSLPLAPFLALPALWWLLFGNWFFPLWKFFAGKMQ